MTHKLILIKFIRFLKNNNIYKEYLINLKNDEYYRKENALIREHNEIKWLTKTIKECPTRLIVDAFSWPYDPNGIDWHKIDQMWNDRLKKNEK